MAVQAPSCPWLVPNSRGQQPLCVGIVIHSWAGPSDGFPKCCLMPRSPAPSPATSFRKKSPPWWRRCGGVESKEDVRGEATSPPSIIFFLTGYVLTLWKGLWPVPEQAVGGKNGGWGFPRPNPPPSGLRPGTRILPPPACGLPPPPPSGGGKSVVYTMIWACKSPFPTWWGRVGVGDSHVNLRENLPNRHKP